MSPPIDIDGSEIQKATIDGQNVNQVTIDGQEVFVGIPDSVIDNFESGNKAAYNEFGDGNFDISTDIVSEGSFALSAPTNSFSSTNLLSSPGDGLDYYPQTGVPHKFDFHAMGTGDFGNRSRWFVYWGHSSNSQIDNGYRLEISYGDTSGSDNRQLVLSRVDGGSRNVLNSTNMALPENSFYEIEILHKSNGDIITRAIDGGSEIGRVTATDSTYLTGGQFDHRGVGHGHIRDTPDDALDNWRTNPNSNLL